MDAEREQRLIVKFVDEALVRADSDGRLFSRSGKDLTAVNALMPEHGISFKRVFSKSEESLRAFEQRAEGRAGKAQADFAGYFYVIFLGVAGVDDLLAAGNDLQSLDIVEFVEVETLNIPPPSHDPPPETPDFVPDQTYRGPDPGIDVDYAWSQGAAKGGGIRVTDCEFSWRLDHEDLHDVSITVEPGQTPTGDQIEHGTGVLGIIAARENSYGCSGIAPDADIYVYPELVLDENGNPQPRRPESIQQAC